MRAIVTIVLAAVFVAGFSAYFVGAAVISHLGNAPAVVAAARAGDLHAVVVDVLEVSLRDELEGRAPAAMRAQIDPALRPLIASVITEDWLYDTFGVAYGGFAEMVAERNRHVEVDMRPRVEELRRRLYQLGDRALVQCRALAGRRRCEGSREVTRSYRASVDAVLETIPQKTSLAALIDDLGHRFLPPSVARSRAVVDAARTIRTFRWFAAAALGFLLLLLFLVNSSDGARALAVVGSVVVLAAALNLIVVGIAHAQIDDSIRQAFAERLQRLAPDDPVAQVAAAGSERVVRSQLAYAFGGRSMLLGLWLVGGAVLAALGIIVGRRRRQSPPVAGDGLPGR